MSAFVFKEGGGFVGWRGSDYDVCSLHTERAEVVAARNSPQFVIF